MKKIFFTFIFFLLHFFAIAQLCIPVPKHLNGRHFKLKNKFTVNDTIAKKGGYYLRRIEVNGLDNEIHFKYLFVRFFDSGRVFFSDAYCDSPHFASYTDLVHGRHAYYIVKNGTIKIETYDGKYNGYDYEYATCIDDKLCFYKMKWRKFLGGAKEPMFDKYVFIPCNLPMSCTW